MGKTKKIFIFFIFILVVVCFLLIKAWIMRNTSDGPGMANAAKIKSLYYSYGPDEYGGAESIYMSEGSFSYSNSFTSSDMSAFEGTYAYDAAFEQSLEEIVTAYKMRTWTDLPASDLIVDDGPVISFKIEFEDGTVVTLGDAYEMPDNGWKAVSEITDLFENYMKEHA